jgi:GDP-L-fucose synthase
MTILVLGGQGMLGSALVRSLANQKEEVIAHNRLACDLTDSWDTYDYIKQIRPTTIYHAAGLVGGILSNMNNQYDYLFKNVMMASNVINAASTFSVPNLFYISSSCVYPSTCAQPMKENMIFDGYPEETNRGYALAKLVGMELTKYAHAERARQLNYLTMIPCNLYGPGDDFSIGGHVLASLIKKICDAQRLNQKTITIWGSGAAFREFLHVDDCASAITHVVNTLFESKKVAPDYINIGSGKEISIMNLALLIREIVGWNGEILCDKSKPMGMMRKLLDIQYLNDVQWSSKITLREGIERLAKEYNASLLENQPQ